MRGKHDRIAVLIHRCMASGGTQSNVYAGPTASATIWLKIREKGPSLGQRCSLQVLIPNLWGVTSSLKLRMFFPCSLLMSSFWITAIEWLDQVAHFLS